MKVINADHTNRKFFLAADLGAGNIKLWTSKASAKGCGYSAIVPSLISYVNPQKFIQGDKDVLPSSLFQMGDKAWFCGDDVTDRNLTPDDPAQDANLKVDNALPLLLSALVLKGYLKPGETTIGCVVSHHDPVSVGAKIRESLQGTHTVIKDGETYTVSIHLPERGVLQEGCRVAGDTDHKYGVLDLGYLTSLFTLRSATGDVIISHPCKTGVGQLIQMITTDAGFRSALGGLEPEKNLISAGILELSRRLETAKALEAAGDLEAAKKIDRNLYYRASGKAIKFTDAYKGSIAAWVNTARKNATEAIAQFKGTDFKVIAIGGGCLLPGIEKILLKSGIEIYSQSSPIMANVHSLYEHEAIQAKKDRTFEGMFNNDAGSTQSLENTPHVEAA